VGDRLTVALVLAVSSGAWAAPTPDDVTQRFELATRLYAQGNTLEALDELERLSKVTEQPAVLVDLVIVNAELGRPEASVAAADRLLSKPTTLDAARLARVQAIRDEQRQKLGALVVTSPLDGVEVSVAGTVVGVTPLTKPVLARGGTVMLMATAKGSEPLVRALTVPAGGTFEVALELTPSTTIAGVAVIRTATPDATLFVDGVLVGLTPEVTRVAVLPGTRALSVQREGYSNAELVVNVPEGGEVAVPLEPIAKPADETAQVAFSSSEGRVNLSVDGLQRQLDETSTTKVVPGRHLFFFERVGFRPIRRDVTLTGWSVQQLTLVFEPTPEAREELAASRSLRRIAGFTAIGVGAAGAIVSGISAFGLASIDEAYWKKQVSDYGRQAQTGTGCAKVTDPTVPTCQQNIELSQRKLVELGQTRTVASVGFAVSLGAIAAGMVSVFLAPDLTQFDRPISNPDFIRELSVSLLPEGGAAVAASGRF